MRDADSPLRSEIKQNKPFRSPGEEAAVALMRTSDVLHRRLADVVEPHGITHQQYNVLRILRGSAPEPLPTLEIASRMIEQAPGITRLLDRLEAKSLVRRERCKEDRRQVHCWITAAGPRVARTASTSRCSRRPARASSRCSRETTARAGRPARPRPRRLPLRGGLSAPGVP